jgi:oligopeptide transport system substrate-binding protein
MIHHFMTRVVFGVLASILLNSVAFSEPLQVQFASEPTQYDPLFLEDGVALKLAANTLGTLYFYDGKGERKKGLVDSYSRSRDRLHYTFRFKPWLRWSDGKPFHAEQFVLALKRLTEEPVKGALSDLYPRIDLKKTRATDARTAEVFLTEADEQLLNWLTMPPFAPIRPDLIESYSKTRSPVVPTLGAYRITEYQRDGFLLLKKNPEFYEQKEVSIEEVKIRFLSEEGTLLPLLKAGSIDILTRVPVLQQKEISELATVFDVPVEAVTYLAFNTRKPPFNDLKNRLAVRNSLLIPKRIELARLLRTGEVGAASFVPVLLAPGGYRREWNVMPEKVREKVEFTIQSDQSSRNSTILEYVQSELKSDLEWKPKLDLLDWKAHYAKLKSDPAEMYRFGWQNPVSDPSIVYGVLTEKSPNNFTGWSNKEFDGLVGDLRQENRMVKRSKIIYELESILWDEAPVVPLLHQVLRFAVSKRVAGVRANPFGVILFRELRLNSNSSR